MRIAGEKVEQQEGFGYIKQAADRGLSEAAYFVYRHTDSSDPLIKVHYLEIARQGGHAEAIYDSGCCYAEGWWGVTRDLPRGIELFKEAVNLEVSDAMVAITFYYNNPSYPEAMGTITYQQYLDCCLQLLKSNRKQDLTVEISFKIATEHEKVKDNEKEKLTWLQKSAALNYPPAQELINKIHLKSE